MRILAYPTARMENSLMLYLMEEVEENGRLAGRIGFYKLTLIVGFLPTTEFMDKREAFLRAGCLRDAAPDAWGRRVILNKLVGAKGNNVETAELDELTYFLESGSDRIGALDFQSSATNYLPRQHEGASLEELLSSAQRVEEGIPLSSEPKMMAVG